MYLISFWTQERNFDKYTSDFNSQRNKIGLNKISENLGVKKYSWDNWNDLTDENYNDEKLIKYLKIFSLRDIPTGLVFNKDSSSNNGISVNKIVYFNSNILFWKNQIESEADFYEKKIDSFTTGRLMINYYFKDDNGNENYFESDYVEINTNELGFVCGTPQIMEKEKQRISGKPYFGNITKKQADSILKKWKE